MKGCLNLSREFLYRQNDVFEDYDGPPLNWCNTAAIVNAVAAVTPGFGMVPFPNPYGGPYRNWKPEDLTALYFHEEDNWPKFRQVRDLPLCHGQPHDGKYPPEQIPQYHQLALREVFGLGADFGFGANFANVATWTSSGTAVILRLKKPRHFITAVCYDENKMLIGFRDPAPVAWLQETEDADGLKWVGVADFKDNVHDDYTRGWRV
jgi:hypothetical protein